MNAGSPHPAGAAWDTPRCATLSVVSHGHGGEVLQLLGDIAAHSADAVEEVIVTLNLPEPELAAALASRPWPFRVRVLPNPQAQGYGANHNAAFAQCRTPYFGVLNPDIRFGADPFAALLQRLQDERVGCAYPLQACGADAPRDPARDLPTPGALLRRHLRPGSDRQPRSPDWVNGAFMVFRAPVFARLNGFDTGYFMYCEDVDICLRLQELGLVLEAAPEVVVTHRAAHASRRRVRHLAWHLRSLWRLWGSAVYRRRLVRRPPALKPAAPALPEPTGARTP